MSYIKNKQIVINYCVIIIFTGLYLLCVLCFIMYFVRSLFYMANNRPKTTNSNSVHGNKYNCMKKKSFKKSG